jgi:hypothetical protein
MVGIPNLNCRTAILKTLQKSHIGHSLKVRVRYEDVLKHQSCKRGRWSGHGRGCGHVQGAGHERGRLSTTIEIVYCVKG